MPAKVTSTQVWNEIENGLFAVLGTVNSKGEPRTAGIVYTVKDRFLYIGTGRSSLKARNINLNPMISLTVTIEKRVPLMFWIKVPPAVVTFHGEATLVDPAEIDPEIPKKLGGEVELSEEEIADMVFIRVRPLGHFSTYGIGVPLKTMMKPAKASGRVEVGESNHKENQ
jgi:hypothetical protein